MREKRGQVGGRAGRRDEEPLVNISHTLLSLWGGEYVRFVSVAR